MKIKGLHRFRRLLSTPAVARAERLLERKKEWQRARFNEVITSFSALRNQLDQFDDAAYVTDVWRYFNQKVERSISPAPEFAFLRDPTIAETMFVDAGGKWLSEQLSFLERHQAGYLAILEEELAGMPRLAVPRYLTSHNSVHHAYHYALYHELSGRDPASMSTVLEWGGGYGNQARIFRKLNPTATYTIVDTAPFLSLQWAYLSTVLPVEEINVVRPETPIIADGRINLLPLALIDSVELVVDLFISTWALSESSRVAQDVVLARSWFGAKALLLAFQESYEKGDLTLPDSVRVGAMAEEYGAIVRPISFIPGSHYAFL